MRTARDLEPHQISIVENIRKKKQLCVFSKPGLGKTAAVLYGVKMLKPYRTLVLAPKLVCQTVWAQEAAKWEGLKHFTFTLLCQPRNKREKLIFEKTNFHLLNYELVPDFMGMLKDAGFKLGNLYDCIVFDEVSNFKSVSTKRFKSIRRQVINIENRIGMTGTPIGNSFLNLWGEMYVCAGNQIIGRTFTDYKNQYFESDYSGFKWSLIPGAQAEVTERIKPHSVTAKRKTEMPREFFPIEYSLPKKLEAEYYDLKKNFVIELQKEDGSMLVGGPAAVVKNKLRQFESGALYRTQGNLGDYGDGWTLLHKNKIDSLVNLIDSVQGEQFVIVYGFRHELERIMKSSIDAIDIKEKGALDKWLKGGVQCLLIHPASAGHGLNLHLGGCFNMVFFTLPWSYELFDQTTGRLPRLGQKNTVNIYYFTGPEVETEVFKALKDHKKIETVFLEKSLPESH